MKEELTETSPRATDLLLKHLAGQSVSNMIGYT